MNRKGTRRVAGIGRWAGWVLVTIVVCLLTVEYATNVAYFADVAGRRYVPTGVLLAFLLVPLPVEVAGSAVWLIYLARRDHREVLPSALVAALILGAADSFLWLWMRPLGI